jgi:hypothetical protein
MTDEKFENYLREFEPKKPRVLPVELLERKTAARFDGWKRLVAAAAIVLTCGAALWTGLREKPSLSPEGTSERFGPGKVVVGRKKTAFELTRVALEDSAAFEAAVEQESREILPRLDGPDSALRVLAKEWNEDN